MPQLSTLHDYVLSLQRWFVNGNIGCFTGWHIPLALLAIAVLAVTVLLIPVIGLISLKQQLIKVLKTRESLFHYYS